MAGCWSNLPDCLLIPVAKIPKKKNRKERRGAFMKPTLRRELAKTSLINKKTCMPMYFMSMLSASERDNSYGPLGSDVAVSRLSSGGNAIYHRRPSVWPHNTSVTAAALAASPSARCVQDRGVRTSVACWTGSRIPRRRLSPSVGHWSSPIADQFQWHSEAACSTNT